MGSGGDNSYHIEIRGKTYKVHEFTTVGSSTFIAPSRATDLEVLVIAGGGGAVEGGGGAGGYIEDRHYEASPLEEISVTVGAGGSGGSRSSPAGSGENSIFGTLEAIGGGSGGYAWGAAGADGGSGGGDAESNFGGGSGIDGQGHKGGVGFHNCAGGGGGAGSAGENAGTTYQAGGNGGAGKYSRITGTNIGRAGGGAGSGHGGNGTASEGASFGSAGQANTGAGGSSNGWNSTGNDGGSGVVIVRYQYKATKLLLRPFTSSVANGSKEILDLTGNNIITQHGNASLTTDDSKFGSTSCYFDGDGDYVDVGKIGVNPEQPFTVSAWLKSDAITSEALAIGFGHSTQSSRLEIGYYSDGKLRILMREDDNSNVLNLYRDGIALDDNSFHHVVFLFNVTDYDVYVDGSSIKDISSLSGFTSITFDKMILGGRYFEGSVSPSWLGAIDDLNVYDRVLSSEEIAGLYEGSLPNLEGETAPILSLNMESQDVSRLAGNTPKIPTFVNGAYVDTSDYKFSPGSYYFKGDSHYRLVVPNSVDLDLSNRDFVFDCWVNFYNRIFIEAIFAQSVDALGNNGPSLRYYHSLNAFQFMYTLDGSTKIKVDFPITIVNNTWYHIALVRSGANLMFFLDGVQQGSTYNIGTDDIYTSTLDTTIGSAADNRYGFYGNMDEIRFSLDTDRGWTSNFTPPTESYSFQVARPFSQGIIII